MLIILNSLMLQNTLILLTKTVYMNEHVEVMIIYTFASCRIFAIFHQVR